MDDKLLKPIGDILQKFPTIHLIDCFIANTYAIINVSISHTFALYKLLDVFYKGSTQWSCLVSSTILSDINENRVNLNLHLKVDDWDEDNLKREIDYKVCLLKTALGSLPENKGT